MDLLMRSYLVQWPETSKPPLALSLSQGASQGCDRLELGC